MGRHTGPSRFTGITPERAGEQTSEGRKLLATLINQLALGGVKVGRMERILPDGTRLVAIADGTMPQVIAFAPAPTAVKETDSAAAAVWIPRGFVLYPAGPGAAAGWGLPIVQVTANEATPYDDVNVAPGLDVARWTVGGPLGQVLLTRDADAGYPVLEDGDQVAPLMYSPKRGVRPDEGTPAPAIGAWAAYRVEFIAFDQGLPPGGGTAAAGMVGFRRSIFERVNAHRVSIGRDPVFMPLRGRFDSAQATAEAMAANAVLGHFSERFPATYRGADDRAMHDGLCSASLAFHRPSPDSRNSNTFENITCTAYLPTPLLGQDANGIDILSIPNPGPPVTAPQAWNAWITSPVHRALIERTANDMVGGHACITHIGWRNNYAAQHFLPHEQWVSCGNRSWTSRHTEVPVVSWHGFTSLNLHWETMPGTPVTSAGDVGPLDEVFPFAQIQTDPDFPGAGVPITFVRTSFDGVQQGSSLTRAIYARGRCIALAPRNGLVWAAAIQKVEVPNEPVRYRLVALTHHVDDQPADRKVNGCTRYLRVWWVDMPDDLLFKADAHSFIRGVYGEENEGFAWDDIDSPYSWRGGSLLDVGRPIAGVPTRIKYDAQWVFDPDGRNAACLRAIGRYVDYDAQRPATYRWWVITSPGGALVRIALTDGVDGPVPVVAHSDAPPCAETRTVADVYPGLDATVSGRAVAVGYTPTGAIKCAFEFYGTLTGAGGSIFSPDGTTVTRPHYAAFGFGDYAYLPPATSMPLPGTTMFHRAFRPLPAEEGAGADDLNTGSHVTILDVRDEVVVAVGLRQRGVATSYDDFNHLVYVEANPAYEACWSEFAGNLIRARVWRKGERLGDQWFGNPDNSVPANDPEQLCFIASPSGTVYASWLVLPLTANPLVQGTYSCRGGDWIVNIVAVPSVHTAWFDASLSGEVCNDAACNPLVAQVLYTSSEARTVRGGFSWSSIGGHDALLDTTQTPAGGWFAYVRMV